VLKEWVHNNLGAGASANRQVTGFAEEADEIAGEVGTYEIAFNLLLQRFLELAKRYDVGFEIIGDWSSGNTRLGEIPYFEFTTSVPEGIDRTHDGPYPVVITRDRGIARGLEYEIDTYSTKNVAYTRGEKSGLAQTVEEVYIGAVPTDFNRREAILDVEGTDDMSALTVIGEKFLGDEGAEIAMVKYIHSLTDFCIPLTDFFPGDLVTYYDSKLNIGPLQIKVESISCQIGGNGVETYEVQLGSSKKPALTEDANFRAAGKRKTLYIQQ